MTEPNLLAKSYDFCRKLTRERAKNFYYGIQLLPQTRRDSLCAVYAFFRVSDDLSDNEALENRTLRLNAWKQAIRTSNVANEDGPLVLPAFRDSVEKFEIPAEYFEELVDGTSSDLHVTRYQTFQDLYRYCYQVASTVGLVCLHIFGFDHSQEALEKAEARGIAFQLTNILRDVAEDGERGRIYLPLEDLARFEISETEFLEGLPSPNLRNFLDFQIDRAKSFYERSADLKEHVHPESQASLEAMTSIYRALLGKIERMGPQVFQERARLSKMEKLALAGKTALAGLRGS